MTGKKQPQVFKQQIAYTKERATADNITPAIIPTSHYGILPLSLAQQRLWFLAQFDGVSETYHIPTILYLRGQLDIAAWQQALNTLFARHEALRTVFVSVDGQPQVRLLASDSGLMLFQYDLRGLPLKWSLNGCIPKKDRLHLIFIVVRLSVQHLSDLRIVNIISY